MRRSILLCLFVVTASCAPKPETIFEETIKAADQGHCDGFSQRFSAATRQMMGPKLDRMCAQQAAKSAAGPDGQRIAEVQILTRTVTGDVATITAAIHHKNGVVDKPITARMVKEDGVWRLEPSK